EPGRRIPNTAGSGAAWADGRTGGPRGAPLAALGTVVTLVGGAVALASGAGPRPQGRGPRWVTGVAAPALAVAFVIGATAWGLYGVALAPELAVTPLALAPLVEVGARLHTTSWRQPFTALVASGIVGLYLGLACTW